MVEGNTIEVTNPTNGSRHTLGLGVGIVAMMFLFSYIDINFLYILFPILIVGIVALFCSMNSKDVRKTVINLETRNIEFYYSNIWSSDAGSEIVPLSTYSMIMLDYSPAGRNPGSVVISLSGMRGQVGIFCFLFTYGDQRKIEESLPDVGKKVKALAVLLGLRPLWADR